MSQSKTKYRFDIFENIDGNPIRSCRFITNYLALAYPKTSSLKSQLYIKKPLGKNRQKCVRQLARLAQDRYLLLVLPGCGIPSNLKQL